MTKKIFKKIIAYIILVEAKLVLKKYKPKIIAVTGSVGKTTSKDAIYAALSQFYFIRKSLKTLNTDIGVPLTIIGCPNGWSNPFVWMKNILEGIALIILPNVYPKWLVLEIGIDKPGDMEYITSWLKPDIVVLTRLSKVPVHVEFFSSPQAVMEEKGKLVKAVKPNGVVILNADDEDVLAFRGVTKARTILFSADTDHDTNHGADLVASNYAVTYEEKAGEQVPTGITFRLDYDSTSIPVTIYGSLGHQYVYTCLAALSVGVSQGLNLVKLASALSSYETPPGRMKILEGIKNSILIDDTYNSSPVALASALDALADLKSGRKIAVLGDMLELGKYSTEEHRTAGARVAEVADVLITIGVRARFFAEGALGVGGGGEARATHAKKMKEKNIIKFEDSKQAKEFLKKFIKKGDIVLLKGSQSMRVERVTEGLLAHPEYSVDLLVRQDKDWLKRQ
ncbi:hypothetical protein EXS61_00345 [Candidatus Parcubacteria bacterium]|nr:hypothetical protein [Candidatus Parcubacteria bacterium]